MIFGSMLDSEARTRLHIFFAMATGACVWFRVLRYMCCFVRHKVLQDLGHLSTPEPFQKLVNQGLILGEDGQKMSKSLGNVVNPDDIVRDYGADSLRLYEMFMGPLQQVGLISISEDCPG